MYEMNPSQLVNIGWFLIPVVYPFIFGFNMFILVPLLVAFYKYLVIATWHYHIYDDKIVEKKGIFDVTYEEMRYFRIKSIMSSEPFWMRILGLGTVTVKSSEEFKPLFNFYAVVAREELVDFLNDSAAKWRKEMGVREHDINNVY